MASIRKCIICGDTYEYCPNCAQNSKVNERWRMLYCKEDCRNISEVINKYGHNHITELEAQEKLSSYDLSNRSNYVENIKNILDKIFSINDNKEDIIKDNRPFKSKRKNKRENIVNDDLIDIAIDKNEIVEPSIIEIDKEDDTISLIDPIV